MILLQSLDDSPKQIISLLSLYFVENKMSEETKETCSHCQQVMLTKNVTLLRKKKGKLYSFTDTPAQVCPECGERWFAAETLKMVDEIIKGSVDFPFHPIEALEFSLSSEKSSV